ncbi:hypothetical protein OC835_002412 [Tilletia horrida]|nr:hypothetical protein OC835_002412 [Tilletia horrida]
MADGSAAEQEQRARTDDVAPFAAFSEHHDRNADPEAAAAAAAEAEAAAAEAEAAAMAAMLDDEDALLQAAINASLAEHDTAPSRRGKQSDLISSGQATMTQRREGAPSSARPGVGHARNKKSRSSNHTEAGPSTPSTGSTASAAHGSPRRRYRPAYQLDHEQSGSARLSGWNDAGIRMNAQPARSSASNAAAAAAAAAETSGVGGTHSSASSSRNPAALTPGGANLRNRTQSSMSIDFDNDDARLPTPGQRSVGVDPDNDDAEFEALMAGPSGARARRRSRAQSSGGSRPRPGSVSASASASASGAGTPIQFSAGSGRRSTEHRSPAMRPAAAGTSAGDDSIEFLGAYSAPNARGVGGSSFGRSADSDIELLPESYGSGSARRSPFLHPALRNANLDDIPQDDNDDVRSLEGEGMGASAANDAEDDFEITGSRRAAARSGGQSDLLDTLMQRATAAAGGNLGPMAEHLARFGQAQGQIRGGGGPSSSSDALRQALAMQNAHDDLDGDLDEEFDEDGEAAALAHMRAMQSYLAAGGTHAGRNYDDEDEALQAALAASLADAEAPGGSGSGGGHQRRLDQSTSSLPEGYDPDAFEAQADAAAIAAAMRSPTPPPQDVERIARMREEARRKEQEERERAERRARGEEVPSPPPPPTSAAKKRDADASDEDDDDDDDEEDEDEEGQDSPEEVISAEEMRRRRLARFNA